MLGCLLPSHCCSQTQTFAAHIPWTQKLPVFPLSKLSTGPRAKDAARIPPCKWHATDKSDPLLHLVGEGATQVGS